MVASGSSSLSSSLGSRLELDDNGAYGLFMQIGATAQLGGHPGSEISVQRNGSVGLVAGWGSRLHARAEVRDNGFAGVYVGFGSSIDLDAPVTGNSVFGIWAEEDAAVDYNGPEISGHAVGMLLDGTEACITDATVSDPVQLVFGSRVHFTGGNDFTGGVTCDDTVLVRGDVSCPAPALSLAVTLDPRAKALAADLGGPFELEQR